MLQAPHLFERLGLRPVRGVLLHGPPGSGKTVLACAAAADAGAALFVLNGPDIISEYHGESEAGLQVAQHPCPLPARCVMSPSSSEVQRVHMLYVSVLLSCP